MGRRPLAVVQPQEPRPETDRGRYVSDYPTDGRDLVLAWGLTEDAYTTESVKVARYLPGTNQTELIFSSPLGGFRLADVVRRFGPGRYLIKPGPGPNGAKSSTLNISAEYARSEGWQEVPPMPPSASDAFIADRMVRATKGPLDSVDVATMIQLAVEKAIERSKPTAQPAPSQDPLESIMKGYQLCLTMMEQAKSMVQPAPIAAEPASIGDAVLKYAPDLISLLREGLGAMAPRMQPRPMPQSAPVNVTPNPSNGEPMKPEPVHIPITPEEAESIKPIVAVLHQYGGQLVGFLRNPETSPEMLANQLVGLLGPDLDESMLALADVSTKHGASILTFIHPEAGTQKALETIQACARIIRSTEG